MTKSEKVELASIPLVGIGFWLAAPLLPNALGVGRLILMASALLLLQSLIRDIWLLVRQRARTTQQPRKMARCVCIESTVGATGIVLGGALLGFGIEKAMTLSGWSWSILATLVTAFGFLIKDYVVEWSPWRIRKDKDHVNIVLSWT